MQIRSIPAAALLLAMAATLPVAAEGWFTSSYTGLGYIDEDGLDDDAFASNFSGGYAWNDHWGVEAGFAGFNEFEDSISSTQGQIDTRFDLSGWTLGVNAFVPMENRWYVTARAGVFFWDGDLEVSGPGTPLNVSVNEDGTDFYVGAGIGYQWFRRWSAGLGITYYGVDAGDFDSGVTIVGLQTSYRF